MSGWIDKMLSGFITSIVLWFDKIKSFFSSSSPSSSADTAPTGTIEKFANMIGIPREYAKYAKSLFSDEAFGKTSYEKLRQAWEKYQKNPNFDLMQAL